MKKGEKSALGKIETIKQRKSKTKAFVEAIKANRKDESKPANIIFTNIKSEKKKVKVPDWLRYLFT